MSTSPTHQCLTQNRLPPWVAPVEDDAQIFYTGSSGPGTGAETITRMDDRIFTFGRKGLQYPGFLEVLGR